jgi:hypothetical protein
VPKESIGLKDSLRLNDFEPYNVYTYLSIIFNNVGQ